MKYRKIFLIVFLLTPSSYILGNGRKLILYDSFNTLSFQWHIPSGNWKVKNGTLHYNGKSKENRMGIRIFTGDKNWSYYSTEVKLKRISPGNPIAWLGIATAIQDKKNFLILAIKENGYYLGYSKDGKWNGKWEIKKGIDTSKFNTIRLDIYRQGVEAYLNGEFLDSLSDIPFYSGGIGFIFDSSVYNIQFDYVKIERISLPELDSKKSLTKKFSVSLISHFPFHFPSFEYPDNSHFPL